MGTSSHVLSFAWLEITGKCQLRCTHCYAGSGPHGSHGTMTARDWTAAIDQTAALRAGMVQFIGGEPTLHPGLPTLVAHALGRNLEVEIFTNLVHVPSRVWDRFVQPGVRLATSYYATDPGQHEGITLSPRSYSRTKANIAKAMRLPIPLRVGVIQVREDQPVEEACDELRSLGVTDIRVDRRRQVGRVGHGRRPDLSLLCGHCGGDKVAIGPDGSVWPCVFSRWLPVGNVLCDTLADILSGSRMAETTAMLSRHFSRIAADDPGTCQPPPCDPKCGPSCSPACNPSCWPMGTGPCTPRGGCQLNYR